MTKSLTLESFCLFFCSWIQTHQFLDFVFVYSSSLTSRLYHSDYTYQNAKIVVRTPNVSLCAQNMPPVTTLIDNSSLPSSRTQKRFSTKRSTSILRLGYSWPVVAAHSLDPVRQLQEALQLSPNPNVCEMWPTVCIPNTIQRKRFSIKSSTSWWPIVALVDSVSLVICRSIVGDLSQEGALALSALELFGRPSGRK